MAPDSSPALRLRDGAIASLFILGGLVLLLALTRTDVIAYAPQRDLFYLAAGLIALAIPGPLLRAWDLPGQLLLWNAAGWCLGLSLLGMASIGAITMFPLVLLAFAITFWPREDDWPVPWAGLMIAFIGGGIVCWALWEMVYTDAPAIPL